MLGNFIFFYSGSSATLSPWRSGESCRSKDQREDPLTCSTEANQTKKGNRLERIFRLFPGSGLERIQVCLEKREKEKGNRN